MDGIYRDTRDRMENDPTFHAAMMTMVKMATEHGFTPGELKQIAFAASVYVEERNAKPFYLRALQLENK